jgi:hypothetical protein
MNENVKAAIFLGAMLIFAPAFFAWFIATKISMGFFVLAFGDPLNLATARGRVGAKLIWVALGIPVALAAVVALLEIVALARSFLA